MNLEERDEELKSKRAQLDGMREEGRVGDEKATKSIQDLTDEIMKLRGRKDEQKKIITELQEHLIKQDACGKETEVLKDRTRKLGIDCDLMKAEYEKELNSKDKLATQLGGSLTELQRDSEFLKVEIAQREKIIRGYEDHVELITKFSNEVNKRKASSGFGVQSSEKGPGSKIRLWLRRMLSSLRTVCCPVQCLLLLRNLRLHLLSHLLYLQPRLRHVQRSHSPLSKKFVTFCKNLSNSNSSAPRQKATGEEAWQEGTIGKEVTRETTRDGLEDFHSWCQNSCSVRVVNEEGLENRVNFSAVHRLHTCQERPTKSPMPFACELQTLSFINRLL